jgi:hypothetical protein
MRPLLFAKQIGCAIRFAALSGFRRGARVPDQSERDERDEYDDFARHAGGRLRQTGEVVGTVRLALPKAPAAGNDVPVQNVSDPTLLRALPRGTIGEVSLFAPAKQRVR